MRNEQTLCWDCSCATNKGCSWSRRLKPVKGWVADETERGYLVRDCPRFDRDAWDFGLYRTHEEYAKVIFNREQKKKGKEKK